MHYSVIVFGEDVEEQLDPFNEQTEEEKYLSFYDGTNTKCLIKYFVQDTRDGSINCSIFDYAKEDDCIMEDPSLRVHNDDYYKEKCYEIYDKYKGEIPDKITLDGIRFGYMRNKNSFWDWYTIGGRSISAFLLKEGKTGKKGDPSFLCMRDEEYVKHAADPNRCDVAKFGDIDWEKEKEQHTKQITEDYQKFKEAYDKSEKFKKGESPNKRIGEGYPKDFHPFWGYGVYSVEPDNNDVWIAPTLEQHLEAHPYVPCYGFVLDGKYYSRDIKDEEGGYVGQKDITVWAKELNETFWKVPEDTLVTMVDCHS